MEIKEPLVTKTQIMYTLCDRITHQQKRAQLNLIKFEIVTQPTQPNSAVTCFTVLNSTILKVRNVIKHEFYLHGKIHL